MTLTVLTDRSLVRAGGASMRHLLVSFTAPDSARAAARPPVNVSLVIDRSGSMGGQKIELARTAIVQALRMLRPSDRFSVVCYDHEVAVLVPSTPATGEAVKNAIDRVGALAARGNTDLGGGWLKGCEQIAEHLGGEQIGRCLLVTDGLANHGIVDHGELTRHADALRQRGVSTSTFGVGADFDERLLEAMSRAGGGHFYYIETAVQIPDYLTSELGETLEIVARDVAITTRVSPGIGVDTLNRFRASREPDLHVVHLGDLTARQEVSVVLRCTFPAGADGATATAAIGVSDALQALSFEDVEVTWTFAGAAADAAQSRNVNVDRAAARLYAADAEERALELNRAGRFKEAQRLLADTAGRIREYANGDPDILAIVAELEREDMVYGAPMLLGDMKARYYGSTNVLRMRAETGKARRTS